LYLALASAAQGSGQNAEADAAVQKALDLQPSNFEGLMRAAALNLAQRRFEQAAGFLQKATRINPASPEAFYNLGLADEGAYNYFGADNAYRQAVSLAPANAGIRAHYAAFRLKLAHSER
jgi:tetratricopeptide (TPR) repeat protein